MKIIEQKFYKPNNHAELIIDGKELENITTLETLKETMKSAYVGENHDMIVYHAFVKYVEQYDMEIDGDDGTETWEEYCVYVVNKHNITDCNWVTSNHVFDNIYIGKTMIVADSIPFIIEEETKTFGVTHKCIDFYGKEEVDRQIYNILDEVKNFDNIESVVSEIEDIIYLADIEERGEEVAINTTIYTCAKQITLDMITDFTKYMENFQEMKEWTYVTSYNLNLEKIIYEVISRVSQKRNTNLDLNHLIGLLDSTLMDMDINWDDVDNEKTTVEEEVINSIVSSVKEDVGTCNRNKDFS